MKLSSDMFSVYGVTPNNPDTESIEKAINGGVKIIQLRMKNAARKEFLEMALKVKKICEGKALFIINDDVDETGRRERKETRSKDMPLGDPKEGVTSAVLHISD